MPTKLEKTKRKPLGRKRGPKPKSIVHRLRALVWYAVVKKAFNNFSDTDLDRLFVKRTATGRSYRKVGRTRTFSLIGSLGVDPNWSEGIRKSKRRRDSKEDDIKSRHRRSFSLVEVVGRHNNCAHTRSVYLSLFWRLVSPPAPTLAELRNIIAIVLDNLGLFRAVGDAPLESGRAIKSHVAFKRYPSEEYKRSLAELVKAGSLDHVALLAALYLEALYVGSLEQALELREAVRACADRFVTNEMLPDFPRLLLLFLIEERVIKNQWEDLISHRDRVRARKVLRDQNTKSVWPKAVTPFQLDVIAMLLYRYRTDSHEFPVVARTGVLRDLRRGSRALWSLNRDNRQHFWIRSLYEPHVVLDRPSRFPILHDFFSPRDRRKKRQKTPDSVIKE